MEGARVALGTLSPLSTGGQVHLGQGQETDRKALAQGPDGTEVWLQPLTPQQTHVSTRMHTGPPPECLHLSLPRMSSACDLVTASTKPAAARVSPGVGRGGLLTGPRASSWAVKAAAPRRTWGHTAPPPSSSIFSQRVQILLPLLDFTPALPVARDAHPPPALPRPAVVEILGLGTLPPTPTPQPFYGPWLSFEISSTWEPKGPVPPWARGGARGRGAWFPVAPSLCRPRPRQIVRSSRGSGDAQRLQLYCGRRITRSWQPRTWAGPLAWAGAKQAVTGLV